MDNYNPRQITRMRWKDAAELEKFKFIAGDFAFATETLENVSQDKTWKKLINILVEYTHTNGPLIIYDFLNENVFVGYLEGGSYSGYSNNGNTQLVIDLSYDPTTDKLQIEYTEEEMLSADNVKTIFGQSIVGTENITMYRHDLTFTTGGGEKFVGVVYSSKDLNVNTFDKLATLIGRTGNQNILVAKLTHIDEATKDASNIIVYWFEIGATWIAKNNTGTVNIALAEVSDVVRPI